MGIDLTPSEKQVDLDTWARRPCYRPYSTGVSVFARFRRTRLTLARALPSLDSALAFARQVRSVRFHDPEHVFVVDDETGETMAEPTLSIEPEPSPRE